MSSRRGNVHCDPLKEVSTRNYYSRDWTTLTMNNSWSLESHHDDLVGLGWLHLRAFQWRRPEKTARLLVRTEDAIGSAPFLSTLANGGLVSFFHGSRAVWVLAPLLFLLRWLICNRSHDLVEIVPRGPQMRHDPTICLGIE